MSLFNDASSPLQRDLFNERLSTEVMEVTINLQPGRAG
jgi:hypothetical protein